MADPKVALVVDKYLLARTKRDEISKEMKAKLADIDNDMREMRAYLLSRISEMEADSISSSSGTVFKKTKEYIAVEDWEVFLGFVVEGIMELIRENPAADVPRALLAEGPWPWFKRDVPKTMALEYLAENKQLPPGLKYTAELDVEIRRPKTSKKESK